ncbi:hypothetical protein RD792_014343 [Penstemon davidsonii]|uniref:K Homology domain-containing protein n=1 Tax=Penstemon davidsonii TaxID=160366 RepID=A0ABR0CP24_9LAMI|nr:hypothetical protein RD792_014343 [Penstemon davidsonii]
MASAEPTETATATAEPVPNSEQTVAAEIAESKANDAASTESPASAAETTEVDEKEKALAEIKAKWPGWPGYSVFRMVVPVLKVGAIIGRKGDLIKKLVEETRARIRVLDGPQNSPDRIVKMHAYVFDSPNTGFKIQGSFILLVLVSGKEEPEAALSPAMDAVIRIFKRVYGLPENDGDGNDPGAAGTAFCSIRLLVASMQAISLIGKQGSLIKSIQESTGASVRVHSNGIVTFFY